VVRCLEQLDHEVKAGHRRVRWLLVEAAVSILHVRHSGTAGLRREADRCGQATPFHGSSTSRAATPGIRAPGGSGGVRVRARPGPAPGRSRHVEARGTYTQ
jgi:hypothetical protein